MWTAVEDVLRVFFIFIATLILSEDLICNKIFKDIPVGKVAFVYLSSFFKKIFLDDVLILK